MKFFVQHFCETVQARMFIFGEQVDNNVLYRGIANQPSPVYSSLYLSNFLSFHTLMKFFVEDFCGTVQARVVIFGMHVDNNVLYRGIANQPSHIYSSLYLSNFLSFHTLMKFFVEDFSRTVQARVVIFGMQVDNDVLCRGIVNQPSLSFSSLYLSNFLSFHTLMKFSSLISLKLCKLEYSYLVCRLIMMYCTVGLQTTLLLLILPCIYLFFFLSTFFFKDISTTV